MDASYCSPLLQESSHFLFDALLEKTYDPATCDPAADPGYFSAASSLSPTSSVDSFCFSPGSLQGRGHGQEALDCLVFSRPAAHVKQEPQTLPCTRASTAPSFTTTAATTTTTTTTTTRKSRSRYPGKKRQTASEREKLRMRDLTKAMHHLRSYLPPSVAPAGQTLTKIETLSLTLRYISYLSDQLGLSDEVLQQRSSSGSTDQSQTLTQVLGHPASSYGPQETCYSATEAAEQACTYQQSAPAAGQFSTLQHSYLVSSEACYTPQQYWMPTQQQQECHYSGQC